MSEVEGSEPALSILEGRSDALPLRYSPYLKFAIVRVSAPCYRFAEYVQVQARLSNP